MQQSGIIQKHEGCRCVCGYAGAASKSVRSSTHLLVLSPSARPVPLACDGDGDRIG